MITLFITKPNCFVYDEEFDTVRDAQKEYFKTRDHNALRKSKALEAEIDAEIARVRDLGYGYFTTKTTRFILSHNLKHPYKTLSLSLHYAKFNSKSSTTRYNFPR